MLKVLHTESSNGWGGQELRILVESHSLNALGTFDCFCLASDRGQMGVRNPFDSVPIYFGPIGSKSIKGLIFVIRFLRQVKPDVVITHSSTDSWLVAVAKIFFVRDIPIIRVRHVSAVVRPTYLTKWLYRSASTIVTTSESIKRHISDHLGIEARRIFSVPTGVDTSYFSPATQLDKASLRVDHSIPTSTFVFGMVSTLRSWKGHFYAIRALSLLKTIDAILVIVGDGPQYESLRLEVKALGLLDRVIFRGYKTDVRRELYTFDVFLQPSYANEGVSQSLLQAMACELPVIVSDIGGLNEVVSHNINGLICVPKDEQSLAEQMLSFVNQSIDAKSLGSAARIQVETNNSLRSMSFQMEKIIESVIS